MTANCWKSAGCSDPVQLPHESTFSRAFAEFAEMELAQQCTKH